MDVAMFTDLFISVFMGEIKESKGYWNEKDENEYLFEFKIENVEVR